MWIGLYFPLRYCADTDKQSSTVDLGNCINKKWSTAVLAIEFVFSNACCKGWFSSSGTIWKAVTSFFPLEKFIGIPVVQNPHLCYADVFMCLVLPLLSNTRPIKYLLSQLQRLSCVLEYYFS